MLHCRPFPISASPPTAWVLVAIAIVTTAALAHAGGEQAFPPRAILAAPRTALATPKPVLEKRPYLQVIGPTAVRVLPVAGPRVRRVPLLPKPKRPEREADPVETPVATTSSVAPSALSPDAPTNLLLSPNPGPLPATILQTPQPPENVLTPATDSGSDLRDAVIYFETPRGPRGSQTTLAVPLPFASPAAAKTQPESRATYRKE